jgi:hypothetical protein
MARLITSLYMTFKVHFNSRATRADLSAPRYVEFLLNMIVKCTRIALADSDVSIYFHEAIRRIIRPGFLISLKACRNQRSGYRHLAYGPVIWQLR